jgi:hypothetical protein
MKARISLVTKKRLWLLPIKLLKKTKMLGKMTLKNDLIGEPGANKTFEL